MSKHSSKGRDWEGIRRIVLERAGGLCEEPSCSSTATHVDHILPKVAGGTDDLSNLQALCGPHNLRKGSKVVVRTTYFSPTYFTDEEINLIAKEAREGTRVQG